MLELLRASEQDDIPSSFAPGSSSSTLLRGGASSSGMSTILTILHLAMFVLYRKSCGVGLLRWEKEERNMHRRQAKTAPRCLSVSSFRHARLAGTSGLAAPAAGRWEQQFTGAKL
jgi:hypothetical protein